MIRSLKLKNTASGIKFRFVVSAESVEGISDEEKDYYEVYYIQTKQYASVYSDNMTVSYGKTGITDEEYKEFCKQYVTDTEVIHTVIKQE